MSYEIPDFNVGIFPADVDMSGTSVSFPGGNPAIFQYTAVDIRVATATSGYGAGNVAMAPPPSAGVPVLGLLQNNPQLGEAAEVMTEGVSKALAGGVVHVNDLLASGAINGSGASPLTVATSGQYIIAKALESGVSGEIIAVYLRNMGKA